MVAGCADAELLLDAIIFESSKINTLEQHFEKTLRELIRAVYEHLRSELSNDFNLSYARKCINIQFRKNTVLCKVYFYSNGISVILIRDYRDTITKRMKYENPTMLDDLVKHIHTLSH